MERQHFDEEKIKLMSKLLQENIENMRKHGVCKPESNHSSLLAQKTKFDNTTAFCITVVFNGEDKTMDNLYDNIGNFWLEQGCTLFNNIVHVMNDDKPESILDMAKLVQPRLGK